MLPESPSSPSPHIDPAVGIAVPVRGQSHFLADALHSLERQSPRPAVALLDATPDASVQRVARQFPGLITAGYHRPDRGQSAAINEGFRLVPGAILGWLNADDLLYPDALGRVCAAFAADPAVDVVFGHAAHYSADGRFIGYFPSISPDPKALQWGCSIVQPSCFFRRTALERVGWLDEARHYTMDWDLWCRLLDHGAHFQFIDRPLSVVRIHDQTKTLSFSWRRYCEILTIARRYNNWRELMGMVGNFLLSDLRQHRRGAALLALATSGLRHLRRLAPCRPQARPAPAETPTLFGLNAVFNTVASGCRLILPWYQSPGPVRLRLTIDRGGRYVDEAGAVARPAGGDAEQGWFYELGVEANRDGVVDCMVASDGPWRLITAQLHAGG